MPDTWLLVLLYNGLLTTSGYTMPLNECITHMAASSVQQMQCVNTHLPICKVHKDTTHRRVHADRCIQWMEKSE